MTSNIENHFIHDIMKNILRRDFARLDVGKRIGHTDYIDYIDVKELTKPIMKGVDYYKRPFIVLRCIVDKDVVYGQTFFQRYTDDKNLWMGCTLCGTPSFISTIGGMTKHQALLLQNIIDGKSMILDENHKLTFNHKNKKIMLNLI
jgi:hypothetical protein